MIADASKHPWHLQMQWKVLEPAHDDENPKVAGGLLIYRTIQVATQSSTAII